MVVELLKKQAFKYGLPAAKGFARSSIDTLTNPQTYIRLGQQADDILRGALPGRFSGAGFKDLPTRFTGALDDLSRMVPGAARDKARNSTSAQISAAARSLDPNIPRPSGQGATGLLRAPNVGSTPLRRPGTTVAIQQALPQTGGPLARDYGLGRSTGAVNEMAQLRKTLQQIKLPSGGQAVNTMNPRYNILNDVAAKAGFPLDNPLAKLKGNARYLTRQLQNIGPAALNPLASRQATTRLGKLGSFLNPLNPMNARGLAAGMLLDRFGPGLDPQVNGLLNGAFFTPGGPVLKTMGALITADTGRPVADGTLASMPKLTPAQIAKANELRSKQGLAQLGPDGNEIARPGIEAPSERPTSLDSTYVPPGMPKPDRMTPNVNGVTSENGNLTTPINTPGPLPDPGLNSEPGESYAPMDPYAYQISVYGQGRQAASSQEEQAAVRDLGLALHRKLYPDLYPSEDLPRTVLQEPGTMNNLDANYELDTANVAVEELIRPEILAQLNALGLRRTGY